MLRGGRGTPESPQQSLPPRECLREESEMESEMDEMELALDLVNHVDLQHANRTVEKLRKADQAAQEAEAKFAKLTEPPKPAPRFKLSSFVWGCTLVVVGSALLLIGPSAPATLLDTEDLQSQLTQIQVQVIEILNKVYDDDRSEVEPYIESAEDRARLYLEQMKEEAEAAHALRAERIHFYLDAVVRLNPWTAVLRDINLDVDKGWGSSMDPEKCLEAWHSSVQMLRKPLTNRSNIEADLVSMLEHRLDTFRQPQKTK